MSKTPVTIRQAILDGFPADSIQHSGSPEPWSAYDIVGHLIHREATDCCRGSRSSCASVRSGLSSQSTATAQAENGAEHVSARRAGCARRPGSVRQ